ncbi:hypothetical protein [Brevibacillus nitrificans]|uniref:hypothetical protein n=1 Tax=Brevibacillus nitrificans TaxID=651560 RepID=UPI00261164FE|nr:hypothetical protein [Brevibacillus nitrificans]
MDTEDKEILKLYLNKHNFIILPTNNGLYYEPTYERVERALKNFDGSYALALEIQKLSVFPTVNEIKDYGWYKYITHT